MSKFVFAARVEDGDEPAWTQVSARTGEISKDRKVVIMCRSGKRSSNAIVELQTNFGYTNLLNLKGGILAWSAEIDSNIPRY